MHETLRAEPFVRSVTQLIGGPLGRHGERARGWFSPARVALAVATVMWLLAVWRQSGCRQTVPGEQINSFQAQCYSDIPLLFTSRGFADGGVPYLDSGNYPVLEYPVLTGWLAHLNRLISTWLGAPLGPGLDEAQLLSATNTFYSVNMVVLFVLFLVAVIAQLATARGREWDTMMLVAAPPIALTGLINWDMLAVALTSLAVLCWARRRPAYAGILLGLAVAAKLYAGLLLGPLLILCLRAGKGREFLRTVIGFAVGWLAANLPVLILAPEAWRSFWTFNSDRAGDFGSIWYLFVLAQKPIVDLNMVTTIALVILCLAVGALIVLAPQRPRIGQVGFLVLFAFVATNKVYSPQYVLWLLPFLALARPRWREWIIFCAGEWLYLMAIWGHLGQYLTPGDGGPDRLFFAATILRLLTQSWVAAMIVRDILVPRHDLVRAENDARRYRDDPAGGVLDGAADVGWAVTVRERVNAALAGRERLIPRRTVAGTPIPGLLPGLDRFDRTGAAWLAGVWIASRVLLIAVALYAMAESQRTFGQVLNNWDVAHFLGIAQDGYVTSGEDAKRMAFFPGLPMLLHAFGLLGIPGEYAGLLISLVASVVAAAALYRMGGFWAAALWLIAPTAVFQFVPYTEALFCAFAFWAWERARSDRWWQAAVLAAGACTVRVSGLFLIGALGVMILTRPMPDGTSPLERIGGGLRRAVWLLLPALVLFGYAAYLHRLTGSWTMWIQAQSEGWQRAWTAPWQSVLTTIDVIASNQYDDRPGWDLVFSYEIVSMAVGILAVGFLVARRMWAEASWIAVQVIAFSTSVWLFSVNRAVLLWFPVWLIAAELIDRKPRTTPGLIAHRTGHIAWVVVSVLTMLWWARMFYLGQWSS